MKTLEPESLMSHISMVFQDVYLFQDTIRNNIRFGKTDATDEEIEAAARKACCHDFIMRLPKGYDTQVGEGVVPCPWREAAHFYRTSYIERSSRSTSG